MVSKLVTQLKKKHDIDEDGFTLVELIVVVLIIGILAAVAIPVFNNQQKESMDATSKNDLKNAALAFETVRMTDPTATGLTPDYFSASPNVDLDIYVGKQRPPVENSTSTSGKYWTGGALQNNPELEEWNVFAETFRVNTGKAAITETRTLATSTQNTSYYVYHPATGGTLEDVLKFIDYTCATNPTQLLCGPGFKENIIQTAIANFEYSKRTSSAFTLTVIFYNMNNGVRNMSINSSIGSTPINVGPLVTAAENRVSYLGSTGVVITSTYLASLGLSEDVSYARGLRAIIRGIQTNFPAAPACDLFESDPDCYRKLFEFLYKTPYNSWSPELKARYDSDILVHENQDHGLAISFRVPTLEQIDSEKFGPIISNDISTFVPPNRLTSYCIQAKHDGTGKPFKYENTVGIVIPGTCS